MYLINKYKMMTTQEEIENDCSKNGRGIYCAALIKQHGWNIPNGYPLN